MEVDGCFDYYVSFTSCFLADFMVGSWTASGSVLSENFNEKGCLLPATAGNSAVHAVELRDAAKSGINLNGFISMSDPFHIIHNFQ